jgi:protease I
VDAAAADVSADDFDAVIVPGGYAPDKLRRYPAVLDLVRGVFEQGRVVAMICHAAWVPISAGILKGRTATCVPTIKDDLINAGATYVDQKVVVDGNLISSRRPADLPAFCRAIIAGLKD